MLINIYLISTLITIIIMLYLDIYLKKRLEKKGYKYKEVSKYKQVMVFIDDVLFMLIPIINILVSIFLLITKDKYFNDFLFDDLFENGKIEKIKKRKNKN